jgi:hypothetical protein
MLPLLGRLLSLTANVRLSWLGMSGANASVHLASSTIMKKFFITLTPDPIFASKAKPAQVEDLSGATLSGRLLSLQGDVKPGWQSLSDANASVYLASSSLMQKKV